MYIYIIHPIFNIYDSIDIHIYIYIHITYIYIITKKTLVISSIWIKCRTFFFERQTDQFNLGVPL